MISKAEPGGGSGNGELARSQSATGPPWRLTSAAMIVTQRMAVRTTMTMIPRGYGELTGLPRCIIGTG